MIVKRPSVRFGTPVAEVPDTHVPTGGRAAEHWQEVADHVTTAPGVWHPVTIGHLPVDRHRGVVTGINRSELIAFKAGGFRAAFREGQLFVRYDAPAVVEVTRIGRRKSA